MKRIILCADDYGQNLAISQAIIKLLEKKRLTAVSCLVSSSLWPEYAKWLQSFKNQVDIGLHFNLTEDTAIAEPLTRWIIKSRLTLLNKKALAEELNSQIDNFIAAMGRAPDFIDGHQHVHQFPQISSVLLAVYEKRLRPRGSYIRSTYTPFNWTRLKEKAYFKEIIIQLCGAKTLHKNLEEYQIPHNESFSGIYDFSPEMDYGTQFRKFLQRISDKGLIMCHPGLPSSGDDKDNIAKARWQEFQYFASERFVTDCEDQQVRLVTMDSM